MVITLTGDNTFALYQEFRRLIDGYVAAHGDLGLERLDGDGLTPARIQEALTSPPMLTDKKLVVLREPGTNKQITEQIEQLFSDISESTDVIIVEPKFDKRLTYYKFLKKQSDFREFPMLDPAGLARWLTAVAKERGGSIGAGDARYLVERVGTDQQLLNNELEKLLLYDSAVTHRTIDLLTDATPQSTIFQLLEAAFAGRTKGALRLYAEQRALNVEPPQIIAMFAWQLHVLAVVKTAGDRGADAIAREAKLNPFVVRKTQALARDLSLARLKTLIDELVSIDVRIKRTNTDPDEALQHYLLTLATG
ncbi:MAG TPA: DNA polymerase III subunit delta [Verrucomicrobiae bacterium]|nr:DNA polymerase III subunit delta [Verrucomicrobiae bacterium]